MNVCVDGGFGEVECEACDGASGVGADAWQGSDGGCIGGKLAVVPRNNFLCSAMEVPCPGVVTEAFPCTQDIRFGGCCERFEGWESLDPPLKVGNDGDDLRLLEHELRDEGLVGVV